MLHKLLTFKSINLLKHYMYIYVHLGHLGRMEEERLPKKLLFGELANKRSCHEMKKRWREKVKLDLQAIGVGDGWYDLAHD